MMTSIRKGIFTLTVLLVFLSYQRLYLLILPYYDYINDDLVNDIEDPTTSSETESEGYSCCGEDSISNNNHDYHDDNNKIGVNNKDYCYDIENPETTIITTSSNSSNDDNKPYIEVRTTQDEIFRARHVVLAAPPKLLSKHIQFNPPLAPDKTRAMANSQTWMAGKWGVFFVVVVVAWRPTDPCSFC